MVNNRKYVALTLTVLSHSLSCFLLDCSKRHYTTGLHDSKACMPLHANASGGFVSNENILKTVQFLAFDISAVLIKCLLWSIVFTDLLCLKEENFNWGDDLMQEFALNLHIWYYSDCVSEKHRSTFHISLPVSWNVVNWTVRLHITFSNTLKQFLRHWQSSIRFLARLLRLFGTN